MILLKWAAALWPQSVVILQDLEPVLTDLFFQKKPKIHVIIQISRAHAAGRGGPSGSHGQREMGWDCKRQATPASWTTPALALSSATGPAEAASLLACSPACRQAEGRGLLGDSMPGFCPSVSPDHFRSCNCVWGVCVYFIDIASIWASISMHVYMGSGCLQGYMQA